MDGRPISPACLPPRWGAGSSSDLHALPPQLPQYALPPHPQRLPSGRDPPPPLSTHAVHLLDKTFVALRRALVKGVVKALGPRALQYAPEGGAVRDCYARVLCYTGLGYVVLDVVPQLTGCN